MGPQYDGVGSWESESFGFSANGMRTDELKQPRCSWQLAKAIISHQQWFQITINRRCDAER
jgi:hypothetical protein